MRKLRDRVARSRIIKGLSWDLNPSLWLQKPLFNVYDTLLDDADSGARPNRSFSGPIGLKLPGPARACSARHVSQGSPPVLAVSHDPVQHFSLPNEPAVYHKPQFPSVPWIWRWETGTFVWLPKGQV